MALLPGRRDNDAVKILVLLALSALLGGCASIDYYLQSIGGQMDVWRRERPIDDWLADPGTQDALKHKLARVLEIRGFASRELQLPENGSYRRYADLQRPYVVWNVFAAEEFSLEPKQSCFLFAGCVGYRGYFSHDDAERYAAGLRAQGFDVYVGGVPAYSTLGWFNDPVLNTFVGYPDTELARIIFHELAHQLVYVKDDSVFNESFAVTVENEGVRRWLAAHGDPAKRAVFDAAQRRRHEFLALMERYRHRLGALYKSEAAEQEKRAGKRAAFDAMLAEYRALKAQWGGYAGYDAIVGEQPNNAALASVAIYTRFVPAFVALLDAEQRDLARFYAAVRDIGRLGKSERDARLHALAPVTGNGNGPVAAAPR